MLRISFLRNLFLLSLLIAIAAPAYLLLVVHPSYHKLLHSQAEASSVQLASYLNRSAGLENHLWNRNSLPVDIEEKVHAALGDEHLVKLRLFSPLGEIIFSTDREEVGQINTKDYFLSIVKQGKVFSKVAQQAGKTADGVITKRALVETYVPFMQGPEFTGAIEIYYDMTASSWQVMAFTRSSVVTILLSTLVFLLAIGLALSRAAVSIRQRDLAEAERKQALQKIAASQHELSTIAENIPVGVFRCDTDGRLLWANSLADFFLAEPRRGEPLAWSQICTPEDVARAAASWERAVSRHKRFKDEFRLLVGGMEVWMQCEVVPEYDLQEKVVGLVGTLTNIADLKHVEAEIKDAQLALMQQEKMASIGQLAAGVAHEINNPMGFVTSNLVALDKYNKSLLQFIAAQDATLAGQVDVAGREALDRQRKELQIDFIAEDSGPLLEESLDGASRVKVIVQTLKDYARVDQNNKLQEDLNECLDTTLALLAGSIPVGVTIEKSYGTLPLINCYTQELQQTFMNIIKNALQAVGTAGVVGVRSWADEQNAYVAISDTGCGIDQEKLSLIFDPFFTMRPIGEGAGLGLSFAYDVVEKHAGTIRVVSEPGRGSTFTISLPIGSESASRPLLDS